MNKTLILFIIIFTATVVVSNYCLLRRIESKIDSFSSLSSEARADHEESSGFFIIDKVKELQVLVGCEKVDGKIGPETTQLVNTAVKAKERELFNSYAEVYMTPSGAPKNE